MKPNPAPAGEEVVKRFLKGFERGVLLCGRINVTLLCLPAILIFWTFGKQTIILQEIWNE